MSASSKKKLRNELNAAKMTERQLQEQKEAKKLKIMTVSFTAALALILIVAIVFASVQFVRNSGIREKNTVALTIGETSLTNAQLNYYYVDAVNEFANNYGGYASLFGLDLTKPLDEQIVNEETGATWADDFTTSAIENAKATYALAAAAKEHGFELGEDSLAAIDNSIAQMELSAMLRGFANGEDYIKAFYGHGASTESLREYLQVNQLAKEFYSHYATELSYDDAALRAGEAGKEAEFTNYSYNYYYLNTSKFLTGGTTAEDGTVTYSDEEKAASVKAAEEAAKGLAAMEITSVEDLDAAIAALTVNAGAETTPKSTECLDYSYANVTAAAKDWITDASRKAGDITYVENATTSTKEDGTEDKTVNGYYVVYFLGAEDNNYPLVNVRHILITPEGGTYDANTGSTTYSATEMAGARAKAEALLEQWKSGEATEESFIALVKDNSTDPGSKDNGGLYEDVYPGQMVPTFNDWCFDEARKNGDTGIVETDYGCHIMFYSSDSAKLYRDLLIENALRTADTESWYTALLEAATVTEGNTKYLSRDLVLSSGN